MNLKLQKKINSAIEFQNIIKPLIENATVQELKNFKQHFTTTRFDHCYSTAYYCYKICKKFHLDYVSATRGAMLHDLFLYNWREKTDHKRWHAFTHGKVACKTACELFELNEKEKNMICTHMWPVTFAFPKSLEGFILTFVDKFCATKESFHLFNNFSKFSHINNVL